LTARLAAMLLVHEDPGPAQLGDLPPEPVVVPARLGELAHLLELVAVRQEVVRGRLDRPLVVGVVEVHLKRGRPRTRSATMFLRISVVPPSIEFARARRKRYVQCSSITGASAPRTSIASSVSAWFESDHCHLTSDPSGPGTPVFMIWVRPREAFR